MKLPKGKFTTVPVQTQFGWHVIEVDGHDVDAIAARRRFVSDAINGGDETAVRDRMAALHRFPGGMLRGSKLRFLRRMPADRRRIKNNFGAAERGQSRRFGIPLVPANADADFSVRGRPCFETEIAGREIKFLVVGGIVGDMHLAIFPEQRPIGINDRRRVVINAGAPFFEKRRDDHGSRFARDFA